MQLTKTPAFALAYTKLRICRIFNNLQLLWLQIIQRTWCWAVIFQAKNTQSTALQLRSSLKKKLFSRIFLLLFLIPILASNQRKSLFLMHYSLGLPCREDLVSLGLEFLPGKKSAQIQSTALLIWLYYWNIFKPFFFFFPPPKCAGQQLAYEGVLGPITWKWTQ